MANWCFWTESDTGPMMDLKRIMEARNAAVIPVGEDDGDNANRELAYHFPETDEWMVVSTPLTIEGGELTARGECKWQLPLNGYISLSKEFPTITMTLGYTVTGLFDAGVFQIKNGSCTLCSHNRGYFHHHPGMDSPIHHRLVFLKVINEKKDDVLAALIDDGIIIPTETCYAFVDAVTTRHSAIEISALVNSRFPGLEVSVDELPYTLNEEVYLSSLHTELTGQRPTLELLHIPQELRPLYAVAERQISLTPQELDRVIMALIGRDAEVARVERLERLRLHVGADVFYSTYKDELLVRVANAANINHTAPTAPRNEVAKLAAWFVNPLPTETSTDMGYGNYFPTKEELEIALVHTTDPARRAELWNAILSPQWTRAWPDWDRRRLAEFKDKMRAECNTMADSDKGDVIEQLKARR